MAAALAFGRRGTGRTGINPPVGCIIVKDGRIIGRGHTQPGGRPHAEAAALAQAGTDARGADIYVTLEPCAHESDRGPACLDMLIAAQPGRVIIALQDPDPRTAGQSIARLEKAGIDVAVGACEDMARRSLAGFLSRIERGRSHVTVKLATSLDGKIAMADGTSRWITSEAARAHVHLERARSDAILVGGGTLRFDNPSLDVRLNGLEDRSPQKIALTSGEPPEGWQSIKRPEDIAGLPFNTLFIEGGAATASSFLRAGLADRLLLYRAPVVIGDGLPCLGDIGLTDLAAAHGRWRLTDSRYFGLDRMELYETETVA
jgi:diaminohydroxyphosphoribosylaminopyrimidine deaminase / 5-amino-6-(5-phosphoribosylamino)uracil reductase